MKTKHIVIGTGAVLLGAAILKKQAPGFWGDPGLNDDDYEQLENAQTNGSLGGLLANDTSPVIITVSGSNLTYEERLNLVTGLGTKYQGIVDNIANNLATEAADVYGRIGLTLTGALPGGAQMTERGLELYLKILDIWSKNHGVVTTNVSTEVTKLWLGAASTDVTSCTQTTFVKDVTEESTLEQGRASSVTIETTAKAGFLGILGKKKNTTEVHLASSFENRTDKRKIVYTPHCTRAEVDPLKLEVLYNTTIMGVKLLYAQLRQSFGQCPDPLMFCKP